MPRLRLPRPLWIALATVVLVVAVGVRVGAGQKPAPDLPTIGPVNKSAELLDGVEFVQPEPNGPAKCTLLFLRPHYVPTPGTAALIGVPLLYVASLGPACWAVGNGQIAARPIAQVYKPILSLARRKGPCRSFAVAFAGIGTNEPEWTVLRLLDAARLIRVGSHRTNLQHDMPYSGRLWLDR